MNLESTKGWLYVIADFSVGEAVIEAVLRAGIEFIQLREKEISSAEYLRQWLYP